MALVRRRRASEIVHGFVLLCHPGPVLFHILAVTVFALLAGWPHVLWNTLLLVVAAHTAMQLSIAVLNDYCDRQRDALSQKNKPIPRGLIRPREALIAGLLLMGLMVILLLPLPPLALLISLLYLACGQVYNLGLKTTPLSGIVFALAIPLIPLYAFSGMGRNVAFLFWLVPIAALLGVALNIANSLPDIEADARSQARTLAVVLGVRGSFVACPLLIFLATILVSVLALTDLTPAHSWLLYPTVIITWIATGALALFAKKPGRRKTYFYGVISTCLLLAGGWFISVIV